MEPVQMEMVLKLVEVLGPVSLVQSQLLSLISNVYCAGDGLGLIHIVMIIPIV